MTIHGEYTDGVRLFYAFEVFLPSCAWPSLFSVENQSKSLAYSNKIKKDEEIRSNSTASPNLTNIRHPSIDSRQPGCTREACMRRVYTYINGCERALLTQLFDDDRSTSKFVPDGKRAFEKRRLHSVYWCSSSREIIPRCRDEHGHQSATMTI